MSDISLIAMEDIDKYVLLIEVASSGIRLMSFMSSLDILM